MRGRVKWCAVLAGSGLVRRIDTNSTVVRLVVEPTVRGTLQLLPRYVIGTQVLLIFVGVSPAKKVRSSERLRSPGQAANFLTT